MKNEIKSILEEFDLTPVEIRVFLAALEIGTGAASTIASSVGLNRITAYEALKRLSRKGLMKIRAKKNTQVKYFVPQDISILKEKLEAKKERLEQTISTLDKVRNEFRAQYSFAENKPTVFFYEGPEGVKAVVEDTLKIKPHEILSFSSAESIEAGFDDAFLNSYWNKRTRLGIPTRGIIPKTEKAVKWFTSDRNKQELRKVKFIPPEVYSYKDHIDIYGDNIGIACLSKGNESGIIIRSKSVAESMRAVFEALWASAD